MTELDDFYNQYHVHLIGLFGVVILIYISIFSLFNNISLNTPEVRPWIVLIEIFLWILLIVIIFLNMKHFKHFEFDFKSSLNQLFGTKSNNIEVEVRQHREPDISNVDVPIDISYCNTKSEEEVFHIPHNKYTYEKAKEVCELMDARLATYDEIEDSYKNGANWCSYGWSNDQLALFPIQKSMYNELKRIPGHERDCGRTGVNGGYMKNKNLKFGVNCYGKKPYAGEDDLDYMNRFSFSSAFPNQEMDRKKKQDKIDKLLIAPFNKEKWSEN
jgi:hypothetical protein